ncbi:MAG: hypothetical protein AAF591_20585 [Verrucomicrobiota bacterium]
MILCVAGVFVIWHFLAPNFKYVGEDAVARMSAEEKEILEVLETIQSGDGYEEVVAILGTPDRAGGGLRPTWRVSAGNPLSQVAVYFLGGEVQKVRWIKIGDFTWEKNY